MCVDMCIYVCRHVHRHAAGKWLDMCMGIDRWSLLAQAHEKTAMLDQIILQAIDSVDSGLTPWC